MKKNKIKNIATIMTVVLGTGILSTAKTLNEGINLGDNTSNAIGSGSLATGRGTNAIGSNAFASGNNMTREQYEEFIKENNAKLKEIESKMQEVASARGDLSNLEAEHQDIANKLRAIETYRNQIAEKERQLNEKEPILTREIEVKKGEKVSYRTQIEDLERRLNIIGQLDFSTINDSNRGQAIDVLAQDLKTKMENGVTFLSEYGENGIPVEEYKKAILKQIDSDRKYRIQREISNIDSKILYHQKMYDEIANSKIFVYTDTSNNLLFNSLFPKDWSSMGGRESYLDNNGDFIYNSLYYMSPIDRGTKYKLNLTTIKNITIDNLNTHTYDSHYQKHNIPFKDMIFDENKVTIFKPNIVKYIKQFQERYDDYTNQIRALNSDDINLLKKQQLKKKQLHILEDEFKNNVDDKMLKILYKYAISNSMLYSRHNENDDNQSLSITVGDIYTDEYIQSSIDKIKADTHVISEENKEKLMKLSTEYNEKLETELSKKFQEEIDRLKVLEKDTQNQIAVKENEIAGYRSDITNLTNLLNGENPGNVDDVTRQINEKKELIANKEREIETLKANITNISDGENALANGTNSRALGKASISIGTNNYTNQESSIALGTNNTVNGEKSIAVGYGHNIQGNRNATLGDPNRIYGNDNFVLGNNITLGSEQNPVNNNLVFGSNINIQNVSNAIVLGNGSDAVENAVSVGKLGAEIKIVNVADGLISEKSKEAINGSQLYKFSLLLDDKLSKLNFAPVAPKVDTSIINADIANALAIAGIPQVSGNKLFSLGAGIGYNAGQSAIALGISGQTPNRILIFKLSGAVNLKKGYSVSAGVNINFGDIEDYNNKKLENEIKKLNERIEKQENKPLVIKDYSKELINLNDKNKDLEKLNKDLSKELEVIKERLNEMNNNVEMNYSLDNFDFDKSELKESHKQILDRLNFKYAKSIFLVGYADEKGTNEYNQKLSEKRAKAVYDYLREKGINQDIYYLGRGKQNLISSIQEKNRRVEISIK